jgi:hypothetical protein
VALDLVDKATKELVAVELEVFQQLDRHLEFEASQHLDKRLDLQVDE